MYVRMFEKDVLLIVYGYICVYHFIYSNSNSSQGKPKCLPLSISAVNSQSLTHVYILQV